MAMPVTWAKCTDGSWCSLNGVNLGNVHSIGVYVIWKPGIRPYTVRVGQGVISDRLNNHRNDQEIAKHGSDLLVTWVDLEVYQLDGVERFLAEQLFPVVGDRFPDAQPIAVNLPGG